MSDNVKDWITINGNHIPVKEGQTKSEAADNFLKEKQKQGEVRHSGMIEKKSTVGGKPSTFFKLDSDILDISGQAVEGETPTIDQIYFNENYASDNTDKDTIREDVKGKGLATKGVINAINYFKQKGFDSFNVDTMNDNSARLMKRLEEKGYVKPLDHDYRFEGDTVTYSII
jgi:hypothetical protein